MATEGDEAGDVQEEDEHANDQQKVDDNNDGNEDDTGTAGPLPEKAEESDADDRRARCVTVSVENASFELAAMVRPNAGGPAPLKEIWEKVVEEDALLPGTWDVSITGALDAARARDWPLCTYLAARCFVDSGGETGGAGAAALSVQDERCLNTLWLEVACPVVLDVPRGQERLCVTYKDCAESEWVSTDHVGETDFTLGRVWVHGYGHASLACGTHGSAEYFNAGEKLELSQLQWQRPRFRRLVLQDEHYIQLRGVLANLHKAGATPSAPSCLRSPASASCPGAWHHVLAYPLAGDLTKVLLRPAARTWTDRHRSAVQGAYRCLGETLLSQCAKSGQWDLVEVLLIAGVACPDLAKEFQNVCGELPAVRRQWLKDISGAANGQVRSLFEIAVDADGEPPPIQRVLAAFRERQCMPNCKDTVILFAANKNRWDAVRTLLQQPGIPVAPFLDSQAFLRAPCDIQQLAEEKAQEKPINDATVRSILDFFKRLLAGECVAAAMIPAPFTLVGDVVSVPGGPQILHCALRLGGVLRDIDSAVVFIQVSETELMSATNSVNDCSAEMLPIDLTGRRISLQDPHATSTDAWLAVLCPARYVHKSKDGIFKLAIPINCIPLPYIIRARPVRIIVQTPCCGQPLEGVPVRVDGRHIGTTDKDGALHAALFPGLHKVTAPLHAQAETALEIQPGEEELEVIIKTNGELFLFLVEMDEVKYGVKLCTNQSQIPEDAAPFPGTVKLPPEGAIRVARASKQVRMSTDILSITAFAALEPGVRCSRTLPELKLLPADERAFEPNEDATQYFQEFMDECQMGILFAGNPLTLGFLQRKGPHTPTRASNVSSNVPTKNTATQAPNLPKPKVSDSSRYSGKQEQRRPSVGMTSRRSSPNRQAGRNVCRRSIFDARPAGRPAIRVGHHVPIC